MGANPFSSLLQSAGIGRKVQHKELTEEERQVQHQLKMQADQKSAKARQNRKRNKV
jgi:hypothetical protein